MSSHNLPLSRSDPSLVHRFRAFSKVASAFAVLTGIAVLAGWTFRIEILKAGLPGLVAMKANAAVAFVLCGVSLWCLAAQPPGGFRRKAGRACALLTALFGVLTLGEYIFGFNLGIDLLLFTEKARAIGTFSPGRMVPMSAVNFVLIGVALMLLDVETRQGFRPAQFLILPATAVSALVALEYLFGILTWHGVVSITHMAAHAAAAFLLLCAGVLCARPDRGLMRIATTDTQGGALWRHLLPAAIVVPAVLGWLRLQGERAGYFKGEIAVALFAGSLMAVLATLIWRYAKSLDRADRERRTGEEQLRAASRSARSLIEASLDPLVTISSDGKITDLNHATELVTGFSREGLIGSDFSDYFTEPEGARQVYEQVFEQGTVRDYPLAIRHASGRITFVVYNASVLKNERGEIEGAFAAARDITERKMAEERQKRAEEALEHKAEELARSNEELAQFAYVASHDLQEPLRKIVAFGDRLATHSGDALDEQARDSLNRMQDAARRMGQLVESLLELSRVATKGAQFEPVDLNNVLSDVLSDLEVRIQKVSGRVEADKLPTLLADAAQMHQLFQNLIGNALKFHRENVPPLVRVSSEWDDNGGWNIHVTDNGIGFEEKYLDRIFHPFQRLNPKNEFEGSGMGLAICNRIVARHAGQIAAHSQPGIGSDFVVTLPAKPQAKEAKAV